MIERATNIIAAVQHLIGIERKPRTVKWFTPEVRKSLKEKDFWICQIEAKSISQLISEGMLFAAHTNWPEDFLNHKPIPMMVAINPRQPFSKNSHKGIKGVRGTELTAPAICQLEFKYFKETGENLIKKAFVRTKSRIYKRSVVVIGRYDNNDPLTALAFYRKSSDPRLCALEVVISRV